MLALFDAGATAEDIARKLTAERVPKGRRGIWHKTMVYRILKREGRLPPVLRAIKPRKPAAELVRERNAVSVEARKLRGQGLSLRQIGKCLSSAGFGPPRGSRWFPSTIAAMLDSAAI